jgi:hypothetical protein
VEPNSVKVDKEEASAGGGRVHFAARSGRSLDLEKIHACLKETRLSGKPPGKTRSRILYLELTVKGNVVKEGKELLLKVNGTRQVFRLGEEPRSEDLPQRTDFQRLEKAVARGRKVVSVTGRVQGWSGHFPAVLREVPASYKGKPPVRLPPLLFVVAFEEAVEPLPRPVAVGSSLSHSLCEKYVSGPHDGKARSLICELAGRPAVLVYTREIDPTLTALLRKLDTIAQGGKAHKMTSACVLLTTTDRDEETLQSFAKREKFQATILAVTPWQWERPYFGNHPQRRNLQKEAAVTVILLRRLQVEASYSFRKGELNKAAGAEITRAAALLLPRKP